MAAARVRFEADSLLAAAEKQILQHTYARSKAEPPWDGYCGLLQLRDDDRDTLAALQARHSADDRQLKPASSLSSIDEGKTAGGSSKEVTRSESRQIPITAAEAQHSIYTAEEHFKAGLQLVKRLELPAAMQHLKQAQRCCPAHQTQALLKIQKFITAIEKSLQQTARK